MDLNLIHWKMFEQNIHGANAYVRNRRVFGLCKLNYIESLFKGLFIHDSVLFSIPYTVKPVYEGY